MPSNGMSSVVRIAYRISSIRPKFARIAGEVEFLDVWQEAYAAIMRYSRAPDGFWVSSLTSKYESIA